MATYNVQPEANKIIKEYAESIGVDAETALNRLINTAASRRKALKKYAGSPKAKKADAPKKAKAPKGTSLAKKKAAPKAKKAKAKKGVAIKVVVDDTKPEAVAL